MSSTESLIERLKAAVAKWRGTNADVLFAEAAAELEALRSRCERMEKAVRSTLTWAEQRCPCKYEEPDPCPLCGASIENLEACKSAENTLPRHVLDALRDAARALQQGGKAE